MLPELKNEASTLPDPESPKSPRPTLHYSDHYAAIADVYSSFPLYDPESSYCRQYTRRLFDTLELGKPNQHVVDIGGMRTYI